MLVSKVPRVLDFFPFHFGPLLLVIFQMLCSNLSVSLSYVCVKISGANGLRCGPEEASCREYILFTKLLRKVKISRSTGRRSIVFTAERDETSLTFLLLLLHFFSSL